MNFKNLLMTLDCMLTGKSWHEVENTGRHSIVKEPKDFIRTDAYYLSDGGYSRLFWHMPTETVELSSVSRDVVKLRWESIRESVLVKELQSMVVRIWHEEMG